VREYYTPLCARAVQRLVGPAATARLYNPGMEPGDFDEGAFFKAVERCGARALLIGRRAMVVLGLPLLTADYDFWLHIDDIERLNTAVAPFGLLPSRVPEEARGRGRYVLENDEHVDVLVARGVPTSGGVEVRFDDTWSRRQVVDFGEDVRVQLPSLDDLILTKQFGGRPRDLEDIRLLEALRGGGGR
jgi:hypothetical protein